MKTRNARNTAMAKRNASIKARAAEGATVAELSNEFGLGAIRVADIIRTEGADVPVPPGGVPEDHPALNDELAARAAEMKRLRSEEGWTLQRIADKYDMTRERVRQVVSNPQSHIARERRQRRTPARPSGIRRDRVIETARHGSMAGYLEDRCGCELCLKAFSDGVNPDANVS